MEKTMKYWKAGDKAWVEVIINSDGLDEDGDIECSCGRGGVWAKPDDLFESIMPNKLEIGKEYEFSEFGENWPKFIFKGYIDEYRNGWSKIRPIQKKETIVDKIDRGFIGGPRNGQFINIHNWEEIKRELKGE